MTLFTDYLLIPHIVKFSDYETATILKTYIESMRGTCGDDLVQTSSMACGLNGASS